MDINEYGCGHCVRKTKLVISWLTKSEVLLPSTFLNSVEPRWLTDLTTFDLRSLYYSDRDADRERDSVEFDTSKNEVSVLGKKRHFRSLLFSWAFFSL